jgi:hypothetical protein
MVLIEPAAHNPFQPTLRESSVLAVSTEQDMYIRELLQIICSDTQFQIKGYNGIKYILTQVAPVVPTVTALNPSGAVVGDPNFTLVVTGTGFDAASIISWKGMSAVTQYVSATQLSAAIDISLELAAAEIPVAVQSGTGVLSNSVMFSLTAPALMTASKVKSGLGMVKEEEDKKKDFKLGDLAKPKVDNEPMKPQPKEEKSKG